MKLLIVADEYMNNQQHKFFQVIAKAMREQMGVDIDAGTVARAAAMALAPGTPPQVQMPGVYARLKGAVQYLVSGVGPENFFGPMQPLIPFADKPEQGVIGRMFDYRVGQNITIRPRAEEAIDFQMLRALAESYDLLRLAVETRKDQIESYEWEIVQKDQSKDASQFKDEIKKVSDFFIYPDREHNWSQWLRMMMEDLLVLDGVAIFPQLNRGGGLYSFDFIDPATIKRVIDEYGRTPMPPDPAYQQVLKGIPAVDYTREQLIYLMRNPRSWKLYGYSPVEQVIMTVNIAMRRQIHQLQFYTEGNVPEALVSVPDSWTSDNIKQFQTWWDSLFEGNTAARRHMKFLPHTDSITFTKAEVVKDEYDEWLARIICYAFSISPTALIRQVNRASGQQIAETAKEEGLRPLQKWIEEHMTYLIERFLNCSNVRFSWKLSGATDALKKAQVSQIYIENKVLTPDEVRDEDLGKAPMTAAERKAAFPEPTMNAPFSLKQPDKSFGEPPTDIVKVDVSPPVINLGDTFIRVMPAEAPEVKIAGVNVTVDQREGTFTKPMTKDIVAKRDPKTGELIGKITETVTADDVTGGAVAKTVTVPRRKS